VIGPAASEHCSPDPAESHASPYINRHDASRRTIFSFPTSMLALSMAYNPYPPTDMVHQPQAQPHTPTVTTPGASSNASTPMMPFPAFDFDPQHPQHQAVLSPSTALHPASFSPHNAYPAQEFPSAGPIDYQPPQPEQLRMIQIEEKQPLIRRSVRNRTQGTAGESSASHASRDTMLASGSRPSGSAEASIGVSRPSRAADRHHPYTRPRSSGDATARSSAGGKQSALRRVSADSPMRFSPEEIGETVGGQAMHSDNVQPGSSIGGSSTVMSGTGMDFVGVAGSPGMSRMRYAATALIHCFPISVSYIVSRFLLAMADQTVAHLPVWPHLAHYRMSNQRRHL